MKIKNIVQSGELLSTEELAMVYGGTDISYGNINRLSGCSCYGLGINDNQAKNCMCSNGQICMETSEKPYNPDSKP